MAGRPYRSAEPPDHADGKTIGAEYWCRDFRRSQTVLDGLDDRLRAKQRNAGLRRRLHFERLGGNDDEIAGPDSVGRRGGMNGHRANRHWRLRNAAPEALPSRRSHSERSSAARGPMIAKLLLNLRVGSSSKSTGLASSPLRGFGAGMPDRRSARMESPTEFPNFRTAIRPLPVLLDERVLDLPITYWISCRSASMSAIRLASLSVTTAPPPNYGVTLLRSATRRFVSAAPIASTA